MRQMLEITAQDVESTERKRGVDSDGQWWTRYTMQSSVPDAREYVTGFYPGL